MPKEKVLFLALPSLESELKTKPFVLAAKNLGMQTAVASFAQRPALLCGEQNFILNPNDLAAPARLVDELAPDFIFSANSRLAPLVAKLASSQSIKMYSERGARCLNHKDEWYEYLAHKGYASPKTIVPSDLSSIQAPAFWEKRIVIKPSFSTGALNTRVFPSGKAFVEFVDQQGFFCENLQRPLTLAEIFNFNRVGGHLLGKFLLQECITAPQIGIEILVVRGKAHFLHAAEILTVAPEHVHSYAHLGPIPLIRKVCDLLESIVADLELWNCHLSPDILLPSDGSEPIILEMNLNPGGEGLLDCLLARGVDYAKTSLQAFMGLPYSLDLKDLAVVSEALPSFKEGRQRQIFQGNRTELPSYFHDRQRYWHEYAAHG